MNKLLVLTLVLFLSGCNSGKNKGFKPRRKQHDELVARVSSIPDTPFFAQVEEFSEDPESMYNLIVRYRFSEDASTVKDFYLEEMERSGWNVVVNINGSDKILLFEKPKLACIIEIRPKERKYTVALGRKLSF